MLTARVPLSQNGPLKLHCKPSTSIFSTAYGNAECNQSLLQCCVNIPRPWEKWWIMLFKQLQRGTKVGGCELEAWLPWKVSAMGTECPFPCWLGLETTHQKACEGKWLLQTTRQSRQCASENGCESVFALQGLFQIITGQDCSTSPYHRHSTMLLLNTKILCC